MPELANIARVESRIASIRARVGGVGSTWSSSLSTPSTEITGPADPTKGFDPFGAVYQQAVAASAAPVATDPFQATTSTGLKVERAPQQRSVTSGISSAGSRSTFNAADDAAPLVADPSMASATPTGVSVGQVGGYGAMPVPAELVGYGNGQIPSSALEPIGQGGHRLWQPAAESWKQLVADAAADGIPITVTDTYRSYDQQVELAERKGLYQNGGFAATPGKSNHGWGMAVDADLTAPGALDWMKANGWKYGYVEAVKREPWHWEFRPTQA